MINRFNPAWTIGLPVLSFIFIGLYHFVSQASFIILLLCVGLIASVSCAIHHAEVIAFKVGEPFGTLVLALSVTIIELALIVSMMISGGPEAMGLARDTIFAAVMIIINAIIGLSLFIGATKHQIQGYNLEGVTAALSVMTVIVVFAMILPNYVTSSAIVGIYSAKQLIFIAFITLVLFIGFTFFQTVRHRDYFLPVETQAAEHLIPEQPTKPDHKTTFISLIMLILSLIAVVMSAKGISPSLEVLLNQAGAPMATLGIIIAAIVLLPEFGAAIRAATSNRLQSSLNLAIGSAIASIGLTIPAVALLSVYMGWQLELGLDAKSTALLVLSLFIVTISLRTGLTTILPGIVHLCIFLTYLFFSFVP